MSVVSDQKIKKYQETAKKFGLVLSEADIKYLHSLMQSIAKEEIEKTKYANKR